MSCFLFSFSFFFCCFFIFLSFRQLGRLHLFLLPTKTYRQFKIQLQPDKSLNQNLVSVKEKASPFRCEIYKCHGEYRLQYSVLRADHSSPIWWYLQRYKGITKIVICSNTGTGLWWLLATGTILISTWNITKFWNWMQNSESEWYLTLVQHKKMDGSNLRLFHTTTS